MSLYPPPQKSDRHHEAKKEGTSKFMQWTHVFHLPNVDIERRREQSRFK